MARACFEEILSNCFHVVDEAAFAVSSHNVRIADKPLVAEESLGHGGGIEIRAQGFWDARQFIFHYRAIP
jgi:hypothetical protein